jgi:GWxTD domain-containing protein
MRKADIGIEKTNQIHGEWTMKQRLFEGLIFIFIVAFCTILYANQRPELPQKYKRWIEEEVVYIITPKEKEVFYELENDRERDLFIEEFWKQRDPTPGTPANEFKDEHYRRIEFANKKFGKGTPGEGWRSDRGRFYIMLGRPNHLERYSTPDIRPVEIWYYSGNPRLGQASYFRLLFFERYGAESYDLYDPMADGPQSLVPITERESRFTVVGRVVPEADAVAANPAEEAFDKRLETQLDPRNLHAYKLIRYYVGNELAEASLSNFPGRRDPEFMLPSSVLLKDVETYPYKRVDDDYAYEFLEHKAVVEVNYSVHYIGNNSRVNILQDPSGLFFVNYVLVPETLSVDYYNEKYVTTLRTSIRMADTEGKTVFQWGRDVPLELRKDELERLEKSSFHLCDSFPMIPGDYTIHLLFENLVTKEFTSFERTVSVPEGKHLQMSPLVLARKVNEDSPYSESSRAFQVGRLQIYPSVNNTFLDRDTLFLFFQAYGLSQELKEEGTLEFTFYSGVEPFQKYQKKIAEYGSGNSFLEEVPLEKFPPGIYTVEASLLDKNGQRQLSERDALSVTKKPLPGSWLVAQTNPPADDPYYSYILGNQFFNKGEIQKAHDELMKAYEKQPDSLDYALSYTRVLMGLREYQKVIKTLTPFEQSGIENFGLFFTLGRASENVGEFEKAIQLYQKGLSQKGDVIMVLNSIGDCYYKLGNKEQALRAWEKSLELRPNQEQIKKLIDQLKEKNS